MIVCFVSGGFQLIAACEREKDKKEEKRSITQCVIIEAYNINFC